MDYMVKNQLEHLTIGNITDEDIEKLDYMGVFNKDEWVKHFNDDLVLHLFARHTDYLKKKFSELEKEFEKNENIINRYIDVKNCSYTFPRKDSNHSYMYYLYEEHDTFSIQGLSYLTQEKCKNLVVDSYRFRKYSRNISNTSRIESNDSFFENCLNDVDKNGKIVFICKKEDLEGFWSEKLISCVERLVETDDSILIICSRGTQKTTIECKEFITVIDSQYIFSFIPSHYINFNFLEESIYEVNKRDENVCNKDQCNLIDDCKFISNVNDIKEKQSQSYSRRCINDLWTLNSGIIIDITDDKLCLSIYYDKSCKGGYNAGKYEAWIVPDASKKDLCDHARSLFNNWKSISHYNVSSDIKKYWLKRMPIYITQSNLNIEELSEELLKGKKNDNKEEYKKKIKETIEKFEDDILKGKNEKERYEAVNCFIVAFSNVTGIFYREKSYFSTLFGNLFCPDKNEGTIRKYICENKKKIEASDLYKDISNMINSNFPK